MRTLTCLLLLSSAVFANTCVSSGSGNWNDPSKWTTCGGGVPGNGDTLTLGAGHIITIPAGYQAFIGVSGAGGVQQSAGGPVAAIQCAAENGNGILVVNGTLTFRGNVEQCSAIWSVGQDAIIEHDSSLASSPGTTHYRWIIGAYLWPDTAKLVIRGKSGHRAIIRNATGSGTFYGFTYGAKYSNQGSGQFDFEYATIDGCGGSSTPCTDTSSHNATTLSIGRCDHCIVTHSGYFGVVTMGGVVNVAAITNSTFTLPADSNAYVIRISPNGASSIVVDTVFTTGVFALFGPAGSSATGTHIRNIVLATASNNYPIDLAGSHFRVAEFDRVLRITDQGGPTTGHPAYLPGGDLTRLMCLMNSNLNPHCFSGPAGDGVSADSVNGGYAEKIGTGSDGDLFLGGPSGPTKTIQNVVSACSTTDGLSMGTFINATGPTANKFVMTRNTICGKDGGNSTGIGFSLETWAGAAGLLASGKNNIVFSATNGTSYLVRQGPSLGGPAVPVDGTYRGVDYNWKWNVSTGPYYGADTLYASPSPPGTHDSSGDPRFVQQRHFLDWGQMLKPSISTWSDIVAEFARMNDDVGYDSRFNILNAYNWLRDGYRPRNPAVMNAGDTGGRVGAMDAYGTPSLVVGPAKIVGPITIK